MTTEPLAITASISLDVPSLDDGTRFYGDVFGFERVADPVPGVRVLRLGGLDVCLLEKPAGSQPSPNTTERRRYERHWTPVHVDFHVHDLHAVMARVQNAGGRIEQVFENPEHGSAAFCADPFGHGFCLLERQAKPATS